MMRGARAGPPPFRTRNARKRIQGSGERSGPGYISVRPKREGVGPAFAARPLGSFRSADASNFAPSEQLPLGSANMRVDNLIPLNDQS